MSCRVVLCGVVVASSFSLTSCRDVTAVGDLFGGRLREIQLWSEGSTTAIVEVGDTVRIEALGYVDGIYALLAYDRVLDAAWRSSDSGIARIELLPPPVATDSTSRGRTLVRGVRPGGAVVTASARGVAGSMAVRVINPVDRLELRTPRDTIFVGDTIEIQVKAVDAGGSWIPNVPVRVSADSSALGLAGPSEALRVVALDTGRTEVAARFRRATGRVELVVARR